ncbi:hypothetical protein WR25_24417 [Diploscapter pachys]|uniref:G-protein coupled receptors family 1 profile domain-containing protein n=1 Tax=Diploscapter pachys TaxID=2018661 RepID=A0A2A2LIZ0_9BILA|nr:hypothetical protein WR25_24417 [Diploscapter pachys]
MGNGSSSAMYMSEISKLSSCSKAVRGSKKEKEKECYVSISARGQDKFRRAKVRSLRITLLLILTYIVTWLPYNLLTWWAILDYESYAAYQDRMYILQSFVILNSVINPFIYGRCQGLKLIFSCSESVERRHKKLFKLFRK